MEIGHLLQNIPSGLDAEIFETIIDSRHIKIERIISKGHITKENDWYDQDRNEWVMVIQGNATLRFEKDAEVVHLAAGMYINIPAHTRHRVDWTDEHGETIWLAIHY